MNIYQQGLDKEQANSLPLTPITFLQRTADVHPDRTAIIHGDDKYSYAEYLANVRRLASALINRGVKTGDTVSVVAANIPAFLDAHYGVPLTGAVLNAINIRLDAEAIAFILDHGECDVLLTDTAFASVVKKALAICSRKPIVIDIDDPLSEGGERLGEIEYQGPTCRG